MIADLSIKSPCILIATLGSEPQVVTATLDILLNQRETISQVIVLHTVSPGTAIAQAVETLAQAFNQSPYKDKIPLSLVAITDAQGRSLQDVDTPDAAQAAFRFLYNQVKQIKEMGARLHFSIAGGRKPLALFGMAAAQLLFDNGDRLWYLFSAGDFLSSKRLHPEPGDAVRLIPIPFIQWSRISPILTGIIQVDDPFQAADLVRRQQLNERMEQMRAFILGSLTSAEQKVVALLVQEGLGDQEIAERLHVSPRTVEQHLRAAYAKAAAHWDLENVNRSQLIVLLNFYYVFD